MGEYTRIISNGSKWNGQEWDSLDKLREVLKTHKLDTRLAPFIRTPEEDNLLMYRVAVLLKDGTVGEVPQVQFFGNFLTLSHVFNIHTNDEEFISEFTALIHANVSSKDLD